MARKQYTGPAVHLPALFYISRIQSDSEGSTMDLQYLLFLQQLRTTSCSWLTPVMMLISHLAVNGSLIICVAVFWGMNRELGYWLISNCLSSLFFNNALKLTACIYRPWIRCPELVPPAGALKSATGYSFPSGHTQIAGSFFGSIAARYGKKKRAGRLLRRNDPSHGIFPEFPRRSHAPGCPGGNGVFRCDRVRQRQIV